MNVTDAILTRKSVRAFRPDPVPKQIVEEILKVSLRAPSGTNTQPWHVYVCTGETQQAVTDAVLEQIGSGGAATYHDVGYYPQRWNEVHNSRRRAVGWGLYSLLGIERGDTERRKRQGLRNFSFFGAPVGIFVAIDDYLAKGNWADVGLFLQTVMLAARDHGLHTCPQAAWVPYQDAVLKTLGAADGQSLVAGISLGYEDTDRVENSLVSEREDFGRVVQFLGFKAD
ncbi:nitroreductase [Roseivivax sp. CAU 1761]